MNHTPGPWQYTAPNDIDGKRFIVDSENYTIARTVGFVGWSHIDDAANARLIAAAPDLLHALRLMLREHDALQLANGETDDRWTAATLARAVIGKAEGQQ